MTVDERLERVFRDVLAFDGDLDDSVGAADIESWDSLSHVTLMFSIEHEFGIQFQGEEFATLDSVGDLRRLIRRKLDTVVLPED